MAAQSAHAAHTANAAGAAPDGDAGQQPTQPQQTHEQDSAGSGAPDAWSIDEVRAIARDMLSKLQSGEHEAALRRLRQTLADTAAARQRAVADAQDALKILGRQVQVAREDAGQADKNLDTSRHTETMLQLDRTKYATARAVSDLQSSLEAAETKLKALETEIDAVKAAEASAKEQEMDVPMMRLALYLGIGVEFFKDEATGEYNQILAKSPARNDMELIDIEKQYSQFYYTNLCWDLCDDLVLV